MIDCVSQTSTFWCQLHPDSLKTPQLSPSVTQLWQPEWFQTWLIDILNVACKCRARQNPSSQEHICLKVGCPRGGAFPLESQTPGFHLFKANPRFWYKGVFPPLPSSWVPPGPAAPLALGSVLRAAQWKDYAQDKPPNYQAVAIHPRIMSCEWLTGKTQGDWVTGKGCHLFIYFPPCVTNSKNRPLVGSRSTREQEEFCTILIGEQLP